MKVTQLRFDVSALAGNNVQAMINGINTVISKYGECHESSYEDITEQYLEGAGLVTLTTYPEITQPDNGEEYAYECREFTIPISYARNLVAESQDWDGWTYEEFMNNYTWDHTDGWIELAREAGMLHSVVEVPHKGEE